MYSRSSSRHVFRSSLRFLYLVALAVSESLARASAELLSSGPIAVGSLASGEAYCVRVCAFALGSGHLEL